MLFQVNFPKEEHVRTLPPDFPLPAPDFVFSEVSDVPLQPLTTQATHCTALSRLWSSSWLCGDWSSDIFTEHRGVQLSWGVIPNPVPPRPSLRLNQPEPLGAQLSPDLGWHCVYGAG